MQPASDPPVEELTLDPVYTRLQALEQQNALLRDLIAISSRLSAMALQGAGFDDLTARFARLVGRDVFVLDPGLNLLARAAAGADRVASPPPMPWPSQDPQLARVLATVAEERRPARVPSIPDWGLAGSTVIAPIGVGSEILGYLAIVNPLDAVDAELDLLTVEHAATVYALVFMRERMAMEVANRFKADLLEALLTGHVGDPEHAREWARLLGYDPAQGVRVLLVVPEEDTLGDRPQRDEVPATLGQRHHLFHSLLDVVAILAPRAVGVVRGGELVVVVPEDADEGEGRPPMQLAGDLERHVSRLVPSAAVTIGIGGRSRDAANLAPSFVQARQAIQIGRLLKRQGTIVAFEELGIYRLLLQNAGPEQLRAYAEEILGPLLDFDRTHQADLVRTLRAFFTHNGSPQAAARELFVHVNTVAYRLQRIERITTLSLADADDRLAAQLALKILDGLDSR